MSLLQTYRSNTDDLLVFAAGVCMALFSLAAIFMQPAIAVYVILLPVVLIGAAVVLLNRMLLTLGALLSCIFVVYNPPGLDPGEVLYYALWLATVVLVLIPLLYNGQIRLQTALDKQYVLIILFMGLGVVTGLLFSTRGVKVFEELLYFYSGVMFYFVFRSQLHDKRFRLGLFIVMVLVFLYVLLRTYTSYRTSILAAVEEWQLNFARGAGNENFLLAGTTGVLIAILYAKTLVRQFAFTLLFIVSLGAVVVTLTRSLWVVTLLSALIVFYFVGWPEKKRMLLYSGVAAVIVGVVAFIYLDVARFILDLLAFRFESFGEGTQDLSLKERVVETQSVWEMILRNPIAGWGFATPYLRHDIIVGGTSRYTSYIHNGYLAIWYKLGLFGLLAVMAYCITLFVKALNIFRRSGNTLHRLIGLLIVAYLPSAALMNITSPVLFTFEGTLLLTTFGCYVSWMMTQPELRAPEPGDPERLPSAVS